MKIEVGKFYRTRSGRVAEINEIYPLDENGGDPYSYPIRGKIGTEEESWTRTGSEYDTAEGVNDLVAEIDANGEPVEAGGCAPPVSVNGPVAYVYDAMGDRVPAIVADFSDEPLSPKMVERIEPVEIKPVVHDEPPPPQVDYEPMAVEAMAALRFLLREVDSRCGGRIEGHSPLADAATLARAVVDRYGT